MKGNTMTPRTLAAALLLGAAALVTGCGGDKAPAPTAPAPADTAPADAAVQTPAAAEAENAAESKLLAPTDKTWTPEAMEELLAPVALYPDIVLGQLLVASANPQEVLDAGNWVLQNQSLNGEPLDEAAKTAGFTPPIRGLMQSPEVVDMMCTEMGWTTELGQAYVNDQAGVLAAVQRLRAQANDAGNLESSKEMKVATEVQEGQQVITVAPPSPQVVYVPQYDPVAVYAPAPASTAVVAPTTVNEGHSTGSMVATGVLSFGAGILVANIFDDDDNDDDWYQPRYYGSPMPYYPPYPYRPRYGGGYYPSHGYNRPPNYQHGFNNNTINVNVNQSNNYWNRYDNKSVTNRSAKSPITAAKPNRPELDSLNMKANEGPKRQAPAPSDSWKNQSSYAGAKKTDAKPGAPKTASRELPKVQGSYAGAKAPDARTPVASAKPAASAAQRAPSVSRPASTPAASTARAASADRGYATPQASKPVSRPAAPRASERATSSAVAGVNHGGADRAASQRGKQSMPNGVPAKAKAGGKGDRKAR
jgi:hypothetical protein